MFDSCGIPQDEWEIPRMVALEKSVQEEEENVVKTNLIIVEQGSWCAGWQQDLWDCENLL